MRRIGSPRVVVIARIQLLSLSGACALVLAVAAPALEAQRVSVDTLRLANPFVKPEARERLVKLVPDLREVDLTPLSAIREIRVAFDTVPCPCGEPSRCEFHRYYRMRYTQVYALTAVEQELARSLTVPIAFAATDDPHRGRYSGSRTEDTRLFGINVGSTTIRGSAEVLLALDSIPMEPCDLVPEVYGRARLRVRDLIIDSDGRILGLSSDTWKAVAVGAMISGQWPAGILLGLAVEDVEQDQSDLERDLRQSGRTTLSAFLFSANDRLAQLELVDRSILHEASHQAYLLSADGTVLRRTGRGAVFESTYESYRKLDFNKLEDVLSARSLHQFFEHVTGNLDDLDERAPRIHVVEVGESLWDISARYYGTGLFWKYVLDRNQAQRGSSLVLHPGEQLLIDRRWVISARSECGLIVLPGESLWSKATEGAASGGGVDPRWWSGSLGRDLVYPGELVPWAAELQCEELGAP